MSSNPGGRWEDLQQSAVEFHKGGQEVGLPDEEIKSEFTNLTTHRGREVTWMSEAGSVKTVAQVQQ